MIFISNLFLANTKPFSQKINIVAEIYLNDFNLLDYGQDGSDYFDIYDSDSRIERYLSAEIPKLPKGFQMSGRGVKNRPQCGKFNGVRSTKKNPKKTLELMFNTCNKLSCPICVRKSCSTKAHTITQKIKDYIWFCITQGVDHNHLVPKHYTLNPNFVSKSGVYIEYFKPNFSSPTSYHKSVKEFIAKYITPYLDASVVFYHEHRFVNLDKPLSNSFDDRVITKDYTKLKSAGHFHVIGFGKFPHYYDFKSKFGFIYTNEGYLNSLIDVYRVARYELSHIIYPVKKIIRRAEWTENQLDYMKKNKEWLRFLGGNPLPIPKINETKSLLSQFSYFYTGNLSPYRIRYQKCKKTNRTKKGLKKMVFKLPMRDIDYGGKIYEITGGIHFRIKDKKNKYKYYTLDEMHHKTPVVNKDMQAMIFKSKLKFGKLYKRKSCMNWISIKKFTIDKIFFSAAVS